MFGASSLFASHSQWEKVDKEYIDLSCLVISEEGIFVNINNTLIQVKSISQKDYIFQKFQQRLNRIGPGLVATVGQKIVF